MANLSKVQAHVARRKVVTTDNPNDVEDDERTQAIIALNIGKGFIHHVIDKDIAKAMWDELSNLYGAIGKHSKVALKIKYFGLK